MNLNQCVIIVKESTRQLILLIGILSIIISTSLMLLNTQTDNTETELDQERQNTSSMNNSNTSDSTGLVGQSINGLKQLFTDVMSLFSFIS